LGRGGKKRIPPPPSPLLHKEHGGWGIFFCYYSNFNFVSGESKVIDLSQSKLYLQLPFKSVAAALLLGLVLGPVGLLYASFWGGIVMVVIAFIVICSKLSVPILLTWIGSCIWAVGATNQYNKKLLTIKK
jgi:hypothetical protein